MKTRIAALALVATAALTLAACAPTEEPGASPAPTDAATLANLAVLETFEWTEADGVPTLTFTPPQTVTASTGILIADGDGEAITEGMLLTLDYVVFQGTDGTQVFSTYEAGAGESLTYEEASMDPALYNVLAGTHVGADVLFAMPDPQAADGSAVFFAMTVTGGTEVLERAEGTAVEPVEGLPVVTLDATGKPSIDFEGAVQPSTLVVQPLIEGEGDVVEVGDNLTVHYTGWLWDGTQFDSSWDTGAPASFALESGSLIEGWVQGLAGQTVGSQVLLVIPPELGYGEAGTGTTIPPNATLVFVVDILAAA